MRLFTRGYAHLSCGVLTPRSRSIIDSIFIPHNLQYTLYIISMMNTGNHLLLSILYITPCKRTSTREISSIQSHTCLIIMSLTLNPTSSTGHESFQAHLTMFQLLVYSALNSFSPMEESLLLSLPGFVLVTRARQLVYSLQVS